jgi:hypothetical protein
VRLRVVSVGVVAVSALALSASARGGGNEAEVVSWNPVSSCLGFVFQRLSGAITGCVPVAGGVFPTPGGVFPVGYSAASDGSIVFSDANQVFAGGGDGGPVWLLGPTGSALEVDSSPYDYEPSISYDGSKVTFARFEPATLSSDIYVVNADGSDLKLVASGQGVNTLNTPEFSPDGGSIAYDCRPVNPGPTADDCGPLMDGTSRYSGVMLMNADGADKRLILIGAGSDTDPVDSLSWSPDGKWLTMAGCIEKNEGTTVSPCYTEQIFAYRTDGSDLFNNLDPSRQITQLAPLAGPYHPQFSPDGAQILFGLSVDDKGNQGNFPYLVNVAGSDQHELSLAASSIWMFIPPPTGEGPPPTVNATRLTVPAVRKLSFRAAAQRLRAAHLRVGKVRHRFSARIRRNRVIAQFPKAGAHAHRTTKQGPSVKLILSRGPRKT